MKQKSYATVTKCIFATSLFFLTCVESHAFNPPKSIKGGIADALVVAAKQSKCSAATVEDYEGTDMSGVTPKCDAIFNACVNESLPCDVRKQKCKQFDKMDRDGSCYKKKRS